MDQRLIYRKSNVFRLIYPDPESSIGLGKKAIVRVGLDGAAVVNPGFFRRSIPLVVEQDDDNGRTVLLRQPRHDGTGL